MRLLIADDHPLFRDAMMRLVARIAPTATVHAADSYSAVLERLAVDPAYDLLLLDLRMPGGDAQETLRHLHHSYPRIPIVIVSASDHAWDVRRALQAGAVGFISKAVSEESMRGSLTRLLAGELPTDIAEVVVAPLVNTAGTARGNAGDSTELTPRQRQVLELMCAGESNKLIARRLGLTVGTVKLHVCAILQALNVDNRTQAVLKAQALGSANPEHTD